MSDIKAEKTLFKKLKELRQKRQENLQRIVQFSFEEIKRRRDEYFLAYETNLEYKDEANAKVAYELFSQFDEALAMKYGNEEQAWDYLT